MERRFIDLLRPLTFNDSHLAFIFSCRFIIYVHEKQKKVTLKKMRWAETLKASLDVWYAKLA